MNDSGATRRRRGGSRRFRQGAPHAHQVLWSNFNLLGFNHTPTPSEQIVSGQMTDYWTNFAKTGNPNGAGLPTWPPYNTVTEPTLTLDDQIGVNRQLPHGTLRVHRHDPQAVHRTLAAGARSWSAQPSPTSREQVFALRPTLQCALMPDEPCFVPGDGRTGRHRTVVSRRTYMPRTTCAAASGSGRRQRALRQPDLPPPARSCRGGCGQPADHTIGR